MNPDFYATELRTQITELMGKLFKSGEATSKVLFGRLMEPSPERFLKLAQSELCADYSCCQDTELLGIDLPLWINWERKDLCATMVIGQDPKRYEGERGQVQVGHAFNAVRASIGEEAGKEYWNFFSSLLPMHRLYLTDCRKIYFKNSPKDDGFIKTTGCFHSYLLRRELEIVQPKVVVTMGKDAQRSYAALEQKANGQVQGLDREHIHIPHFSSLVLHEFPTVAELLTSWGLLLKDAEMQDTGRRVREVYDGRIRRSKR